MPVFFLSSLVHLKITSLEIFKIAGLLFFKLLAYYFKNTSRFFGKF